LLLTGSPSNVAPERYGDSGGGGPFDPARDEMSLAMVTAMIARGKPVFGICRGLQEINVACGGTLVRDLGTPGRGLSHHAEEGEALSAMFAHQHIVDLAPGGVLAATFGRDRLTVNSVHYQGIGRLGAGLTVEAVSPDGVVEAISGAVGAAPLLAVQWHPEWGTADDDFAIRYFKLLGRALRGEALRPASGETT
jgi:putative glutamine amidotransferase